MIRSLLIRWLLGHAFNQEAFIVADGLARSVAILKYFHVPCSLPVGYAANASIVRPSPPPHEFSLQDEQ